MKLIKKLFVIGLLSAIVGLACLGIYAYSHVNDVMHQPISAISSVSAGEPAVIEVPQGASFNQLVSNFQALSLIDKRWPLKVYARLTNAETIVAGEYQVFPGDTLAKLLKRINMGDVISHALVIPEGVTFNRWLSALRSEADISSGDSLDLTEIDPELEHPEGWFFPDTYHFHKGDTDVEILRRAYQRMKKVLSEEWSKRRVGVPLETPYEALILASIIEKEAAVPAEREEIAGVFVRRLQRGMKLQTDPTVIYGLGDDFNGNLTRAHLRQENPYNTYRIKGLPPTPIAMPGRGAIHAALNPADGDSLFFVARGDGTHQFSATLEEHNRAVRQYQLNRKKNYRSTPP
ncbi:MAG: endolytic transglycosylase MltG [bacterium]